MPPDPVTLPTRGGSLLPRKLSDMLFEDVLRTSVVQQLARREPLPTSGVAIPVTTGKPTAGWVAEGGRKAVSDATLDVKLMDPKKIATIIVFSDEFTRGDVTGLFQRIREQGREAIADAFDAAAIHGTNTPFTNYIAETTKTVELGTALASEGGIYKDLVNGMKLLTDDRKRLNGWAADPMFEPIALGAVDTNGRPLLIDVGGDGLTQRLLGRPVGFSEGVSGADPDNLADVRLVGGDWRKVVYGVGQDISYAISREASIEMTPGDPSSVVHLWQDNLVAVRIEAEYGLVIADVDAFVTYTEAGS